MLGLSDGREWPILSKPAVRQELRKRRDLAISGHCIRPLAKHPL